MRHRPVVPAGWLGGPPPPPRGAIHRPTRLQRCGETLTACVHGQGRAATHASTRVGRTPSVRAPPRTGGYRTGARRGDHPPPIPRRMIPSPTVRGGRRGRAAPRPGGRPSGPRGHRSAACGLGGMCGGPCRRAHAWPGPWGVTVGWPWGGGLGSRRRRDISGRGTPARPGRPHRAPGATPLGCDACRLPGAYPLAAAPQTDRVPVRRVAPPAAAPATARRERRGARRGQEQKPVPQNLCGICVACVPQRRGPSGTDAGRCAPRRPPENSGGSGPVPSLR